MHFQNLGNPFPKIENPFPKIENPFAKFLEMHFQKLKIHLQKLKIISEIHGNAFAKSMIFFTVKHFLNAFPKPQNQNAFFFSRESFENKSIHKKPLTISPLIRKLLQNQRNAA
jgi:hypothetical protein